MVIVEMTKKIVYQIKKWSDRMTEKLEEFIRNIWVLDIDEKAVVLTADFWILRV